MYSSSRFCMNCTRITIGHHPVLTSRASSDKKEKRRSAGVAESGNELHTDVLYRINLGPSSKKRNKKFVGTMGRGAQKKNNPILNATYDTH